MKIISIPAFVYLFFSIGVNLKSINRNENFSKFKGHVEEGIFSFYLLIYTNKYFYIENTYKN